MSLLIDVTKRLRNKNTDKVSLQERSERLSKCHACPFLMRSGNCAKCFCFVSDKTWYKAEQCPDKKW